MDPLYFPASLSRSTWITTALLCILFYALSIHLLLPWFTGGAQPSGGITAAGVILFLTVPIALLFAPFAYRLETSGVTICRIAKNRLIPMKTIREVKPVELHRVIRTFGQGGLFGSWGRFRARPIGPFQGYMTRGDGYVALIRTNGVPIVITPREPDAFVHAVRQRLETVRGEAQQ